MAAIETDAADTGPGGRAMMSPVTNSAGLVSTWIRRRAVPQMAHP
ncbi:hypothetical protein ACTMTU_14090 [Streptomyces sp. OZ13]